MSENATPNSCRACGQRLLAPVLLQQHDMPASAQSLPRQDELAHDRGITLELRQCAGCGLVQTTNAPVPYYREVIRAAAVSPEMTEFRRAQFANFVARHGLAGHRVLEVGCGRGEYLQLLAEAGVEAHGIEHGIAAVADCRGRGLNVAQRFIESADTDIPGAPFDAFMILNFLEHLPAPRTVLAGIHHNLVPGAPGLVEVPNFDMMLRANLFSEFISDHLFYFTESTLRTLLESNGFEVIDCEPVWHDYILAASVRARPPLDLTAMDAAQACQQQSFDRFLDGGERQRVAIWGAGHQALATINLLSLASRVRYVVDSAPFKQGRHTPGSHLPIVAPERIARDGIDTVIVMAASYSDEVATIVRQRFGADIRVAVLRAHGLEELPASGKNGR